MASQIISAGEISGEWSRSQMVVTLKRRESLLRAASFAAARFLTGQWQEHIEAVLASLGEAADVSRVYLFENSWNGDRCLSSQRFEWVAAGIPPLIDGAQWQEMDWEAVGQKRWAQVLQSGHAIHGPVANFPLEEQQGLIAQSLVSIAVVPICVEGQWWGALGFDECRASRAWDEAEIEVMHLVADMFGAALTRANADESVRKTEAKYRSIFENAIEGIFQTTAEGVYIDANPSLARIYGYETTQALKEALTNIGQQLYIDSQRRIDFINEMHEKGSVSRFESQIRRKDGEIIWISENARSVLDKNGDLLYYEGTVEDITARKNAEEQLRHNALHDKLTGLANRALCMDRLGQAFSRFHRHPHALFAVLFLDFDRFKNVNDSLGHLAGDQLLISISGRLKNCLRPGDTVARLGGDEFAILIEDIADINDAIAVAERIQAAMREPFRVVGQRVFSSVSVGIAMINEDYDKPEELLRDADMAMYRAKSQGKARHEIFDAGMHTRAVALLQLETDLRGAIDRKEFQLYYQPIVSLDSGLITGFEALIRWQHPQRGLLTPAEFIPFAEENGLILPIGRWVLEEACRQLSLWQLEMDAPVPITMSVNISSQQFSQHDLIPTIQALLTRFEIPAGALKLEITESAIMENASSVTERLLQLRSIGVKLGLDDFGTGYSSLSYLHRFPLDTLKIDRSFIARMSIDDENLEIVRTIVSLGKNLGMDIIAEGVEETDQLSGLRGLECQQGQGFFFARPLASEAAIELLRSRPSW